MPRAYSISVDAIAAERRRVNDDLEKFDVSRVIKLDELALRPMGPRDVHLKILAVSAEHNVDHAALADTVNIAQLRGGKIYPGNSAVAEALPVGHAAQGVQPADVGITPWHTQPPSHSLPLPIRGLG